MSGASFFSRTVSVCPVCLRRIPADRVTRGDSTVLEKTCPEHGDFRTVIWRGGPARAEWSHTRIPSRPERPRTAVRHGCPFDCGLCPDHRQQTCTALVEVTRRCDLRCAFCFADAGGGGPDADPGFEAIRDLFRFLMETSGPCNVQFSGGEPTLRDDLPDLVALGRSLGFPFMQVNTNGLRLAREPAYARRLVEAGLSSVFLQFDGLDDASCTRLRGRPLVAEKISAVEHCAEARLGVVLVPTLVPGVNVGEMGAILDFAVANARTVRGVHFQPVSHFGRTPAPPRDEDRITIPEVLREIEAQTGGRLRVEHFKPPGCENSFCSFNGHFVVLAGGEIRPLGGRDSRACCSPPGIAAEGAARARSFVSRSWAYPADAPEVKLEGPSLGGWDAFVERVRTHSLTISGMAFQDAWTLDLERLADCCIHVVTPDRRLVPFCAFNLTDTEGRSPYRAHPCGKGGEASAQRAASRGEWTE